MVGGVDIQNVVCHGTTGVIYLLHNIESRLGECLGNSGQKTGVVLIDNSESDGLSFSLRQRSFREVDRVLDGAVLEEVLDGVGSHGGGGILGLLSRGTKVGKDNGVLVIAAKIIGEVSDVSAISTVKESLHGLGIHELATSKVEEDSIALAVVDDVSTNDTVGASLTLDVRDVETDVIGISAGSLDAVDESDLTGKLESTLDGKTGVISNNVHSKGGGSIPSGTGANVSKTDNSKTFAHNLTATEQSLVLLDALPGLSALSKGLHVVNTINDATGTKKHTAKDQLLDSICVGTGCVEDGDAQLGHARDRDVVGTGTATGDGTDGVGDLLLLELVAAEEDGVGVGGVGTVGTDVELVLVEALQADGADLVEALDLELAGLVRFEVAVRLPLTAAVLDLDGSGGESAGGTGASGRSDGRAAQESKAGGEHVLCYEFNERSNR